MNSVRYLLAWFVTLAVLHSPTGAQQIAPSNQAPLVPRLVSFSGNATDSDGRTMTGIAGATFAIYSEQYEGSPLWLETQNIQADGKGNYTVQLGVTKPEGLPLDLFVSGQARWLGITINGGSEQARVLLLSVPYALKASDSDTIGGLPPSAFMLAEPSGVSQNKPALLNSPVIPPPLVTSVGLSAPASDFTVTGSPVTGTGTLGLNWKIAPTSADTANAIVKRDASGNFNAGAINAVFLGATNQSGAAIYGTSNGSTPGSDGVDGLTSSATASGVAGINSNGGVGVYGTGGTGVFGIGNPGVYATGNLALEVLGTAAGVAALITGFNAPTGSGGHGGMSIEALGGSGDLSTSGTFGSDAVYAVGGDGTSLDGQGGLFIGGSASAYGNGIEAIAGSAYAGYFSGNVDVTGNLYAGAKYFKIDHPLDPSNKYLYHASVESSEMMDIYTGNIFTDDHGEATVKLPDWFEALNTDFRYQLTVLGQFAQAIIGSKIQSHAFTIRTSIPNVEVSWQVTGIRHDAYALAHPLLVDEAKDSRLRGFYIHPELYGASPEKQEEWARHPETMKRVKNASVKR